MKNALQFLAVLLFCSAATGSLFAQSQTPLDAALRHLEGQQAVLNLTKDDLSGLLVSDQVYNKSIGAHHFYFQQSVQSVPVYNALLNVTVAKDGRVLVTGNRFHNLLDQTIAAATPSLTAQEAIIKGAQHLNTSSTGELDLISRKDANNLLFDGTGISQSDIPAKLVYQPVVNDRGQLERFALAWQIDINQLNSADYWSLRVDAQTGAVLDQNNYTVYCQVDHTLGHKHNHEGVRTKRAFLPVKQAVAQSAMPVVDGATYRVFPWPAESPAHGDHVLVINPADSLASPYGWHDTNGQPGAEFTITRGNNVHAYLDLNDTNVSSNDEPDGGADLVFDFPYNPDWEPGAMQEAAVTNLFYVNNAIHDFMWHFGFDEAGGNFQENNYGNGGEDNDYVIAQAQDGGGDNNANFATPPDGSSGRMQMYRWDGSASGGLQFVTIQEPTVIAGGYPSTHPTDWGGTLDETGISGQVAEVKDDVEDPFFTDACDPVNNAGEVTGKIALIDRGGCEFGAKALAAERAGAIGAIICNFEDEAVGMAAGAVGDDVTIPVVMATRSACNFIRQYIQDGVTLTLAQPTNSGPTRLDGDFDNGIIAHEFGHGISTRLTGGPRTSGCLGGDEQMGEGWSDFFTLVTSVEPGDQGADRRGIGTYVSREGNNGRGIRSYPYSTDMSINPHTYNDKADESIPHGVGSIWCAMLWDLYWAMVDEYGWEEDFRDTTSGNYRAIKLVTEGMRLQTCNPGFTDGRDAILAADELMFNGDNQCLIWSVFARRGLGFFADQGSVETVGDGEENFEPLPTCIEELKIKKSMTDLVEGGEDITVTLVVTNHRKETLTSVVVKDEIPGGATFIASSSSMTGTADNGVITFDIGTMDYLDELVITYKLSTDPSIFSTQIYLDEIASIEADEDWEPNFTVADRSNIWNIQSQRSFSPSFSWFVQNIEQDSRQTLQTAESFRIEGDNPTMRFYHYYNTQPGVDGGLVEYSTDGNRWIPLNDQMFRNGYPGPLAYSTFVVPNIRAFSGNSNGFIPTYIDLSEFDGQDLFFRFRFGTDETVGGEGWFMDDFELMNMVNYNSEACVSAAEGDRACAEAPVRGTIVNSKMVSSTQEVDFGFKFQLSPNPASEFVTLSMTSEEQRDVVIELFGLDGRLYKSINQQLQGEVNVNLSINDLTSGLYFVKMTDGNRSVVEKLIKQ